MNTYKYPRFSVVAPNQSFNINAATNHGRMDFAASASILGVPCWVWIVTPLFQREQNQKLQVLLTVTPC